MIPGLAVIELLLKIVLTAMEGQSAEQRAKMWEWYITDMERVRKWMKLDAQA